ncbi:tetratricopeptide repeat protein [Dehalococcoidia bacterium]|nr:tetratricopeptide repeat protein [Dehalococcoidia bacterium]
MKCPTCGNDNPEVAQFCGGCGTSLSVSKGSGIETANSEPPRTSCPACGNDIDPNTPLCVHCGKKFLSSQNPSGGNIGNKIGGCLIGLVLAFFYGLIPGFFILAILSGLSSWFLPGVSRMWDSSFGPMGLMLISMFIGIFVFPFAGAMWFSKYKKEKKTRLVLSTLLIHTCIAYGLLVLLMFSADSSLSEDDPYTDEEQPTPQESSAPTSIPAPTSTPVRTPSSVPTPTTTPTPTSTPYPTPEGLNYYEQGEQYLWKDENYVKAVESFTEYISLNPNDARGYERRGNSYHALKRYQEALKDYDKAIELNPENPDVYGQRGHVHRFFGQYQDAIKDYDKVIALDSSNEWPYHYKGMTYRNLEQYELAIQSWERYIELRLIESADWIESEQAADAYTNIGSAYIELSQYQKAIDHFDKALAINQNYTGAIRGKEKATENLK